MVFVCKLYKFKEDRQSFKTVTQTKKNMTNYGHMGFSDTRDKWQPFDTFMNLEKKLTIHSHMRNPEKKNYSQGKQDVKTKGIHSTSQKEF